MSKKKKIQVFEYEGKRITFDFGDGEEMVNATEIAKAFGKKLDNFTRLKQTKAFIKSLERLMNTTVPSDVRERKKAIKVIRGGNRLDLQGTWYEQRLALKLAAWLNPDFELWVFGKIRELLLTGQVSIKSDDKVTFNKMELEFYLNKIFDDTLEANRLARFLLERHQLPKDKKEEG